jgi:hypothetical protein
MAPSGYNFGFSEGDIDHGTKSTLIQGIRTQNKPHRLCPKFVDSSSNNHAGVGPEA